MKTHHLKTIDPYYPAVARLEKTFEVRKDDGRNFTVGDQLVLHYFDPSLCASGCDASDAFEREECPGFLGSEREFAVSYIYDGALGGLEPGYVVMALAEVEE